MSNLLQRLRAKPRPFKLALSFGLAALLTALIAVAWGVSVPSSDYRTARAKAPSPLNALVGSVKGTFQNTGTSYQKTEIVDAGASSSPEASLETPDQE